MAIKNKYSDIDLSKYNQGYKASSVVNTAEAQKKAAENAVANFGDFKYSNQDAYDKAMNAYLNRADFKYDLNGDALYQQYKNQYATLGKMAMMDTMGQASALTGGYGNSYASTAGNQAYQGYLQHLNDKIPELYQLALDKYQADGDRLLNNYNMLSQDRATQYGEWGDRYNQLVADRGYYADAYTDAYNRDYGMWNDNRTYDTSQYWNEYNTGYQADRDLIADQQWQKEFDEAKRQFDADLTERQRQYNTSLEKKAEEEKKKEDDKKIIEDENGDGDVTIEDLLAGIIRSGCKGTVAEQNKIRSAVLKEINDAVSRGDITSAEATELKKKYAPTASTGSGGRYAY
jgi:hypothetical protein